MRTRFRKHAPGGIAKAVSGYCAALVSDRYIITSIAAISSRDIWISATIYSAGGLGDKPVVKQSNRDEMADSQNPPHQTRPTTSAANARQVHREERGPGRGAYGLRRDHRVAARLGSSWAASVSLGRAQDSTIGGGFLALVRGI
jgi:hypothetical protein